MNAPKTDESARPLLALDGISKSFGGVRASHDVSFAVERKSITGLIGPNGAGKTTLFNIITGVYSKDCGSIFFDGQDLGKSPVHKRVSMGIARTFQNVELFSGMSVLENVLVGRHVRTKCGFFGAVARLPRHREEERLAQKYCMEMLDFVGMAHVAKKPAGDLPFGWQRLVEIARALASQPRLLLLDEPAAGLNAMETKQLGELLGQIRQRGVTLLLVEHDMSLTMEVCDYIAVLDQGRKIAFGTPRQIQADKAVIAAYLGQEEF
ncbi:MAG: ABC transporter ATP-binding protein [Desulfatibacillaceae bacterium]|nr:ABC transporter ATP-binding protein [Desulfatibacillaceae bacterium]